MSYESLVRKIEEEGAYCIEGYHFDYLINIPAIWMHHLPDDAQVARLAPREIWLLRNRNDHITLGDLNLALQLMDCPFQVEEWRAVWYICHDGRILAPFRHGMTIGKEA